MTTGKNAASDAAKVLNDPQRDGSRKVCRRQRCRAGEEGHDQGVARQDQGVAR